VLIDISKNSLSTDPPETPYWLVLQSLNLNWRGSRDEHELVKAFLEDGPVCRDFPNALQPVGLGQHSSTTDGLSTTKKRHGTFSARKSTGHFRAPYDVPRQLSPEFLLVDLVNELSKLAEDRTRFFLAFAKKPKRWTREALTGGLSLRQVFTQKKFQKDLATRHLILFYVSEAIRIAKASTTFG